MGKFFVFCWWGIVLLLNCFIVGRFGQTQMESYLQLLTFAKL